MIPRSDNHAACDSGASAREALKRPEDWEVLPKRLSGRPCPPLFHEGSSIMLRIQRRYRNLGLLFLVLIALARPASAQRSVGARAAVAEATTAASSGKITLQSSVNQAQPLLFVFRPTNGGQTFSRTLTLNVDRTFTLTDIPRDRFHLWIKGDKW